jgi:hypothetical protein
MRCRAVLSASRSVTVGAAFVRVLRSTSLSDVGRRGASSVAVVPPAPGGYPLGPAAAPTNPMRTSMHCLRVTPGSCPSRPTAEASQGVAPASPNIAAPTSIETMRGSGALGPRSCSESQVDNRARGEPVQFGPQDDQQSRGVLDQFVGQDASERRGKLTPIDSRRPAHRGEGLDLLPDDLFHHLLFGAEVAMDKAVGDACSLGYLPHGHPVHPPLGEKPARRRPYLYLGDFRNPSWCAHGLPRFILAIK